MATTTTIHHSAGQTIRTTTHRVNSGIDTNLSDTDCKVAKACISPLGALGNVALIGAVIKAPILLPVTLSVGFLAGITYFTLKKAADCFAALGDFVNQN